MKNASVMNDLVRISDKIAENSRNMKNAPKEESGTVPGGHTSTVPAVTAAPVRNPALMQKRFEEYLRTRKDLAGRLAEQLAALEWEEKNCAGRMEEIRAAAASLRILLEKLPDVDALPENGFRSTAEQADSCRALEILRLETIKLAPAVERLTPAAGTGKTETGRTDERILLDSLTFRQIFRTAFIVSLPWTLGAIAAAAIIAFAVIGSFKGLF